MEKAPFLQRKPALPAPAFPARVLQRVSKRDEIPAMVQDVLRMPGQPLDERAKAGLEPRFGEDFSQVRVHTDPQAVESARAVAALAYTMGQHIVFGDQQYAPGSTAGRRLIAHELAHVVQQRRGSHATEIPGSITAENDPAEEEAGRAEEGAGRAEIGAGRAEIGAGRAEDGSSQVKVSPAPRQRIMRQPNPAQTQPTTTGVRMPPTENFQQMWRRFDELRDKNQTREALQLVPALLGVMIGQETMDHAGDLVVWLIKLNEWTLAKQALSNLESAWWVQFVTKGGNVPWDQVAGWSKKFGPEEIEQQAEQQAQTGQHERARELFGVAYLLTQMQLITRSDARLAALEKLKDYDAGVAAGFTIFRIMSYSEESSIIGRMRKILSFYSVRERKATAEGNSAQAGEFAKLGAALRQTIHDQYLLTGDNDSTRAITLEATQGQDKKRGPGYTLHGANDQEEFVTPLPGEPLPDELGKHPVYTASMEELTHTIGGQEDFVTEVLKNPQVRKDFGDRQINMNDLNTRLKVWRAMYAAYQIQPAAGCSNALCSLLRLMERYLRNFTLHTGYDIRDFGVSYLDSTFPEDLAGRTMRDCGVYAVTVAYEVFQTAHGATPRLPAGFQLYSTMEHTMLVITDQDANEHYVVSNDKIEGPKTGDPAGTVAGVYANVIGRRELITAAGRSQSLSSTASDATFRAEIWQRYQAGAHLGLRPEAPKGPEDKRTEGQREGDTYTNYYKAMDQFDQAGRQAHAALDGLQARLTRLDRNAQGGAMSGPIQALTQVGTGLTEIMAQFLSKTNVGLRTGATRPVEQVLLTNAGPGQTVHPILRIGKALMYYESLGNTLSADQQTLLDNIRKAPLPSFPAGLKDYDAAGRPLSF